MSPVPLPTLDELARNPARVAEIPPEQARALLLQLAPLREALRLQALQFPVGANGQGAPREGDRLLTVAEVAARLGRSRDYVYRRAWPFEVRGDGRGRRFSAQGLDRYLRRRAGP